MDYTQRERSGIIISVASFMSSRRRLIFESALIAIAAALLAFVLLTLLHSQLGRLQPLDLALQAQVHGWTNPQLTRVMLVLTSIGSIKVFIPVLLLSLLFFLFAGEDTQGIHVIRKRHTAMLFGFAISGALVLNESLKTHFHRARPAVPWSIGDEATFSFPSGHSLFSVVLYGLITYLVLARHTPRVRRVLTASLATAMPFGIGLSRIYLGMHYPTDVLAGYLTGGLWLGATIAVDRRWSGRRLLKLRMQASRTAG